MNPSLLLASLNLSLGGLVFLLGLLILHENSRQRLNRVVASMLFFGGLGSILSALSFATARGSAATTANSVQNVAYIWEFFFPTLFLFASIFPEERPFTRAGRGLQRWFFGTPFVALVYLPHVVHFVVMFALSFAEPVLKLSPSGQFGFLTPLLALVGLLGDLFVTVHQALFSIVNLGFGLAAVALLANSYQRARVQRLRQQLRAIGLGLGLCLLLYSLASLIPTLSYFRISEWVRSALTAAALTLGSGSIAYSIVRHKFLDAKLLVRRGILYGVASAAVVGFYLVVVVQLNRLLTSISGVPAGVVEPVFLIVALIVFQPTMSRLEEVFDRLFLRDTNDYRNVLRNLGRELLTTLELDVLLGRAVGTIGDALLLRRAWVLAFPSGGVVARSATGDPPDPDIQLWLREVVLRLPPGEESVRISDVIIGLADEDRVKLRHHGVSLILPLRSRGEAVGALLLGDKVTGTSYTSEDVSLLSSLAGQMAVSLQNALLVSERVEVARFEQELQLARQIQRSFLLSDFPVMPRFDVHALNIPSKEVGGDFYDLVPTPDGGFVVAIADVAGKGVPAALLSSMLQASLRTQAASIFSMSEILRNINSLVYRGTSIHQFATFFIAQIHGSTMRMTFSNAGHNYPLVARLNGEQVTLERGGIVLGIMESPSYEEDWVALESGDCVLLYTDGITEATAFDQELFGEERLCDLLRRLPHDLTAREVTDRILEELREFLAGEEPRDDMTLMVIKVLEPEPVSGFTGAAARLEVAEAEQAAPAVR